MKENKKSKNIIIFIFILFIFLRFIVPLFDDENEINIFEENYNKTFKILASTSTSKMDNKIKKYGINRFFCFRICKNW